MPYYVFRLSADKDKPVTLQQMHASYRDAKQHVKDLRSENPDEDLNNFRLVFAENDKQARILLTTKRVKPQIEEWES